MSNEREEKIPYEKTAPDGAGAGESRRRLLPVGVLLVLMLACAWLSARALSQTLEAGQSTGSRPIQGIASQDASAFVNDPTPTYRSGSDDPAPVGPQVLAPALASPTAPPGSGTGEGPQTPPDLPTATPTATPETPTATPVTPTATPETPTATPVTPTATPETPTATPETPTATPVTPTATPVTPTATPQCLNDVYEPDNTYAQAQVISTDGVRQCHANAERAEVVSGTPVVVQDEDWVTFNAVTGHGYNIGTQLVNDINQSDGAANDTLLYLYDTNGTTQLAYNDDVGSRTDWYMTPPYSSYHYRESLILWTAPADGWYFVRELQWGPTAGYTIRDAHLFWLWVLDLTTPTPLAAALGSSEESAAALPEPSPTPAPTSSAPEATPTPEPTFPSTTAPPLPTDPPATQVPSPPADTPQPSPTP
jgi:hypothetical protein